MPELNTKGMSMKAIDEAFKAMTPVERLLHTLMVATDATHGMALAAAEKAKADIYFGMRKDLKAKLTELAAMDGVTQADIDRLEGYIGRIQAWIDKNSDYARYERKQAKTRERVRFHRARRRLVRAMAEYTTTEVVDELMKLHERRAREKGKLQ